MLLKKLIKNCPLKLRNIEVSGLSSDSRSIKKDELFFALKGSKKNGADFLNTALSKGASAVITANKNTKNPKSIYVKNVRKSLGFACAKFFSKKPKNILAVTGTNGKTSVADFFHQILTLNKIPVASIGTLGVKTTKVKSNSLTSPDIISFHKELARLKTKKINNVIVEASSHGLHQRRLDGVNFMAGIFTNFSQDHIDYHKNMKKYLKSKLILFNELLAKNKYLISDDQIPQFKILKKIANKKNLKVLLSNKIEKNYNFSQFNLIGNFQKKNLMMAIKSCELIGLNKKRINKCLDRLKSVKGRLELVKTYSNDIKVFIDFAHTPDAIKNAICSLKDHYKKNITIVFGCGGERDKDKRDKIGKIVNKLCNKIYVTDDNPRNEKPELIRKTILKNIKKENTFEIGNRKTAITTAIKNSNFNEIILIAGKGHENTQDYGKFKINISDYQIVKNIKISKNRLKNKINKKINKQILALLVKNKMSKGFLGVSIDSKSVKRGNLFIALKGKKNDGHNYLKESFFNGALGCIVSKKIANLSEKKVIKVKNSYLFLKKLAALKRLHSNAKIIAITGSAGKTSVKNLVGNLLTNYGKTYFSPKSYNNSFGVPISICNLEQSHEFGVFEIGMSKKGEIDNLSKLVKPHIAIITNIAEAHIENFKNLFDIAKAKSEIINNIEQSGYLILDRESKFYNFFKKKAKKRGIKIISVGYHNNADIQISNINRGQKIQKVKIRTSSDDYLLKNNGQHVKNIAFAVAILEILNLKISKIEKKIKSIDNLEGRGKVFKIKYRKVNFNLIDESYNANPLSVKESILKLSNIKNNNKKYILLGDMLELGKNSQILHKKLSPVINNSDIDKLFIHGNHIMNTYKEVNKNKRGNILQYKSDFKQILLPILQKNDYLMIKGSNATELNEISKKLIKGKFNAI